MSIERVGDPFAGVALVLSHEEEPAASRALAHLLRARLAARFPGAEAFTQTGGLRIRTWVRTPADAAEFVSLATAAALTPISLGEPALDAASAHVSGDGGHAATDAAARGLSACSGQPVPAAASAPPALGTPDGTAWLEGARKRAFRRQSVAFGVVGPRPVVTSVLTAVSDGQAWPAPHPSADHPPTQPDSIPAPQVFVADAGQAGVLDVGIWSNRPALARGAARSLGAPPATLRSRLSVLPGTWDLRHVSAATQPGGSCIRVQIARRDGSPSTPPELAQALKTVVSETERSLRAASTVSPPPDDDDPRRAAAVAAWTALISEGSPDAPARSELRWVRYQPGAKLERELAGAALDAALRPEDTRLDLRHASEPGHGDIRVLLASTCGTAMESGKDAGVGALLMESLSRSRNGADGVQLAPWSGVHGVGLVARARTRPGESGEALARRVAGSLGETLVATQLEEQRLYPEPGPTPPPSPQTYAALLNALAPQRVSSLDPRGDPRPHSSSRRHRADLFRNRWLSLPLRLAVIGSAGEGQAAAAEHELTRWLGPFRGDPERACPKTSDIRSERGLVRVVPREPTTVSTNAYVAVPFRTSQSAWPLPALWSVYLMNRPGGWLDQALESTGLAGSAQASLLGGQQMGAIAVEVRADPAQLPAAVELVRAVFGELALGAVTEREFKQARAAVNETEQRAAMDPTARLIRLWLGPRPQGKQPDLKALKSFFAQAFRPRQHVVVMMDDGTSAGAGR